MTNSIQTVWTVLSPLRSGQGFEAESSLFEIINMTPTSLPLGPVTVAGGQNDLKPSICVVSAIEWLVSVSVRTATDTICLTNKIRI